MLVVRGRIQREGEVVHLVVYQLVDLSPDLATEKVGRVRTCKLGFSRLADETAWIEEYRRHWASRFDALDQVVEELKQKEKRDGRS